MNAEKQAASSSRTKRIEPLTRLATGGMADIWLAREVGAAGVERFVVTKRLLPHLARDPEVVDMFVSEARFVARLVHPNVVQIHELAEDDEGYFLVMEYVAGCSVRELTMAAGKARRKFPPDVAVCIVEQACRGAHAAHELRDAEGQPLGLVHRDISPHNLMIGPQGDVKLLDFGIAKATQAAEATRTGTVKGKHGYMSPEQCRATRVDRRSDVFALGIVCWELLTGQRLFKRETEFATMEAIAKGDSQLPTEARADLPSAFDAVVSKALVRDLDARWQTADQFRRALIEAADRCGVRRSRDDLAVVMMELLGSKIEKRERALRGAASPSTHPDPSMLHDVLTRSETSMPPPAEQTSRTGSDDIATVVQRRGGPSTAPPPDGATTVDDGSVRREQLTGEDQDDVTLLDRQRDGQSDAARRGATVTERPPPPPRASRLALWVLLSVLLAGAGGALAFFLRQSQETVSPVVAPTSAPSSTPAPPAGPPLRFAVAPTIKPEVLTREFDPFLRWLGRSVDRPVELTIADSYEHTGELVTSGRAHFGLLPPLLFVRTFAREPRLQPLAVRLYDGSRASDGYLLVREDAELSSAADLEGRTVCHVDRTSTTGFLLPRIWMRKAGLDPDKDVTIVISGDHLAAMRDLSKGKCDAASVYSGAYLSARKEGIAVGTLRLLAITGRVPQDTIAAAPDMPATEVGRLREALLGFDPKRDIDAGRLGDVLGISGFAPFDSAEFVTIRKAAEQEGMVPKADAGP